MPDDAKMTEGERVAQGSVQVVAGMLCIYNADRSKRYASECAKQGELYLRFQDCEDVRACIASLVDTSLAAQRAELETEIGRLRGMLARIEWTGFHPNRRCPCCTSSEGRGEGHHYDGCELAAILKEPINARQP